MKNFMNKTANSLNKLAISPQTRANVALSNQKGDQNVGQAIVILITVVLGALLLAGLYTFHEVMVLPTVTVAN